MAEQKFYLTKQGLERVKKEHDKLVEFKRLKTTGEVPAIWHSEDVNPEYLAFQEDMTLLETKLAEYENILKNVELIAKPSKEKRSVIGLGARVTVRVDNDQIDEYEILGTLEVNPSLGKISNESPVGRALLGHKVGDEVPISSPKTTLFRIMKIQYGT